MASALLVVRLECSREMDLVAYESHGLVDRRERAQVKSCEAFVSEKVRKSSTPTRVKKKSAQKTRQYLNGVSNQYVQNK
jgi:hypothetical protein